MLDPVTADETTPPGSITESAYQRLRNDLLTCRLAPGERLNINKLCESLGVSLGAVREALARLTSEGLVIAEPQRGFCVTPISAEDLIDLTNARTEIEILCLRRSIAIGGVDWEANIVAAEHRLMRTPDRVPDDPDHLSEVWGEAHRTFHEALVGGCDSKTLLRIRRQLYAESERYRRAVGIAPSVPLGPQVKDTERKGKRVPISPLADAGRNVAQEHREMVQAVLGRQADRAAELMAAHLSSTTQIILEAMKPAQSAKSSEAPAKRSGRPPAPSKARKSVTRASR